MDKPLAGATFPYAEEASLNGAHIRGQMDQETTEATAAEYKEIRGFGLCVE